MSTVEHTGERTGEPSVRAGGPGGTRAAVREGAGAMAPLVAGYVPFALVIGVAAGASPDPLAAWAGSLLIFAGSAHLLVIDLVGSGAGLWAAVTAAVVVNARLLVFSATLAPMWRNTSVLRRMAAAAVVIDPLWALTSRRMRQEGTMHVRRHYYAGAASVLLLGWTSAVAAGALLGGAVPDTGSGPAPLLQMCVPACLAAVVGPHLRTSSGARAVLAAVVVAWVGRDWPSGTGLLVAMAAAALAGSGMRRRGEDR